MGWIFSVGIFGLLFGVLVGGMLVDCYGCKCILIGLVVLFGLFLLVMVIVWDFFLLVFVWLMIGVGLGVVLLNFIVLMFEVVGLCFCGMVVSLMYCGVFIGVVLVVILGFVGVNLVW